MHALDHLPFEALRPAGRRRYQAFGASNLVLAWRESGIAWRNLPRMDQRLAVETVVAALFRFSPEAVVVLKRIEHAVEGRDAGGACGEDDGLKRHVQRPP